MTKPALSVIIVSYNTKDLLRRCLRSLHTADSQLTFEVIVVDNASVDGSPEMVAQEFPAISLLRKGENLGFAKANNVGIRISGGRYLLLLNSDTEVLPGALEAMVREMESRPRAGVVGCRLLNIDRSLQPSLRSFPTLLINAVEILEIYRILPVIGLMARLYPYRSDHSKAVFADWVSGACLLVRREAVEQIGPLDEDYFMYGEEMDWCYRMRKAGWHTFFTPVAEVVHHGGGSSSGAREKLIVEQYRSLYRFYLKHYSRWALIALKGLVFTLSTLKVLVLLLVERSNSHRRDLRRAYWEVATLGFRE